MTARRLSTHLPMVWGPKHQRLGVRHGQGLLSPLKTTRKSNRNLSQKALISFRGCAALHQEKWNGPACPVADCRCHGGVHRMAPEEGLYHEDADGRRRGRLPLRDDGIDVREYRRLPLHSDLRDNLRARRPEHDINERRAHPDSRGPNQGRQTGSTRRGRAARFPGGP